MDYASIADMALTMLEEYGMAMTLTRQTSGTFSPVTGAYTGAGDTDYAVTGLPQTKGEGDRYFPATTIQAGDRFILLAASGLAITPQAGDKLTFDGVSYAVITSMPVSPGGTDLLYRLLVRK